MMAHNVSNPRSGRLVKLFYECVENSRPINTSHDAKLFFQAVDFLCAEKGAAKCLEIILSKKQGAAAVGIAVRSNLSSDFICSTTIKFLKHLRDPRVKTINDGQFLTDMMVAILSPPTFWTALQTPYQADAFRGESLTTFAWLCLEIVSTHSPDLLALISDVKNLLDTRPLLASPDKDVRALAYKIQKVMQIRAKAPEVSSATIGSSPGGRHDNDFEDFRQISIYPTADEIVSTQSPFLQRLDDVFETPSEHRASSHLDWLFRLLREDMLGEMREDLQIAWGQKQAKRKPLALSHLRLVKFENGNPGSVRAFTLWISSSHGIRFPNHVSGVSARKHFLENSKNFVKHNSFGALCSKKRVVALGSVVRDVDRLAQDPPAIGIQFTDIHGLKRALVELLGPMQEELKFYLVDTAVFAYEPVLKRLQETTELPLDSEILFPQGARTHGCGYSPPPEIEALLKILSNALINGEEVDLSLHVHMEQAIRVRGAQLQSLINGLRSPLGQIQGPPGTGKSFIGALIVLILLRLTFQRVLVLSYTNHALDQFLEDLMKIGIDGGDMVRLGSKASALTEPLRIESKGKSRMSRYIWEMIDHQKLEYVNVSNRLSWMWDKLRSRVHAADILGALEFVEQGSCLWEAFQVPDSCDGFKIIGKENRVMKAEHIYESWARGKDIDTLGEIAFSMPATARNLWNIAPDQRRKMDLDWSNQVRRDHIDEFVQLAERSDSIHSRIVSLFQESKRDTLRGSRVIGCTTTAAAMYQSLIKAAEPDIVLVEEAGEILEAHVITALSPSVKQLILIGDHKQLRPKVDNYKLTLEAGEGFDLNVSLFERLIRQGHDFTTLQEQHRSHPDISHFARLLAYEELTDDPATLARERIRGLRERVAFVHHEHPEEQLADVADRRDPSSKASKKNAHEAEMVLRTVKFLNQQGYHSENIVVLTPYLGQLSLLRQRLSEINDPYLNDLDSFELVRAGLMTQATAKVSKRALRLSTIDNYQGEESDIVVVSMTRSNPKNDIGFLIARERLVVLMSRAKAGIILFGNMKTFMGNKKGGSMWKTYFNALKEKGFLFDGLPVKCEQHPDRTALIKEPGDFDQHCPDGGCAEACNTPLNCGKHKCELRCHRVKDHSQVQCTKRVERTCDRGHKSKIQCGAVNAVCRDCAREDEETRRRAQRDLDLEKSRLEREEQYRRQLQEMDDEIDHHRRKMKYSQEQDEQERTIEARKAELEALRDTQRRMETAKKNAKLAAAAAVGGSRGPQTTQAQVFKPSRSGDDGSKSSAGREWKAMKDADGASNPALDGLMDLIGLESVKAEFLSVKSMVDQKIRQGISLEKERLSCSLLGNPGTGKTTVARLWGKFLTGIGAIAGDCFEETTGSKLANIRVSGCEALLEKIKDNGGGVFFIDEAYQLSSGHSPGGKAVLDYLLAEVENLRGKVVFVLAGYSKQMESFFSHNPGFPSRFPIEMKFDDYSDEELRDILEMQVHRKYAGRMQVEGSADGLFFRIAARRVGRGRGREGFGNARAVENALAQIERRQVNRIRAERRAEGKPDDFLFTKEDIIGPEPSMALSNCKSWQKLNDMIGLKEVKQQAKTLLDSLRTNYERELAEEPILQFSLNQVFLGSPGTGKTTVAKLYGQILADLGILSNGEVVVKTPADFIGSALGQSEAQTKGILAATVGKVLVIDEAYGLYGGSENVADIYKVAVVDTIVGEVQNVPGDDRCVILIGYQEQMDKMFQSVNPGLSRRFAVDNPFVFEDFDDDALREVLELKMKATGFTTTKEGKRVALEVLMRERDRPNFGNGGAIENLLSKAKLSYQKRKSSGRVRRNQLDPIDFDKDFERSTSKDTNVRQLFHGDIGREDIIEKLEAIQSRVRHLRALDMDVKEEIPFNFIFRGPPGTGKSTTARKMGKVYYDMGFLSDASVKDCSATDLIGQYIGHTAPKVKAVLDSALGKVLLIDEAYRLAQSAGGFAKEAIDELVDCLTRPKYQGKLIVILAGYDEDMKRLLSINPGLQSRFPETINFTPLSPSHCFDLLVSLMQQRKRVLSSKGKVLDLTCLESPTPGFHEQAIVTLNELSALEGWASARDVKTLAKNVFMTVDLDSSTLTLQGEKVLSELTKMLRHGQERQQLDTLAPVRLDPPLGGLVTDMQRDAPVKPAPVSVTKVHHHIDAQSDQVDDGQADEQRIQEAEEVDLSDGRSNERPVVRDAGVSDAVWEQLQLDKAEEERREQEYRKLRKAAGVARGAARDKIVKELLEEERRRKEEAEKKARLAATGVCPVGYEWIKQESGYRCAGGIHFVSEDELR